MTAREYIAAKLAELRKSRNLSVEEVGKAVGRSGKTISAWEVGRGQPDADMLVRLARYYGVSIAEFYVADMFDSALSDDEAELVELYRGLSDESRNAVLTMAAALTGSTVILPMSVSHHQRIVKGRKKFSKSVPTEPDPEDLDDYV